MSGMANPYAECPVSCEKRNLCIAAHSKNRSDAEEIVALQKTLATADERIAELERALQLHSDTAVEERHKASNKAMQANDVSQRKTIDNLAGETYELRRIMRESKHFDMSEVQATVSESLAKYRLAVEEDR